MLINITNNITQPKNHNESCKEDHFFNIQGPFIYQILESNSLIEETKKKTIHSFVECLLNAECLQGMVLGTGDVALQKTTKRSA